MNYFEVTYLNCFGEIKKALAATKHATPEIPTADFNFDWNGNKLVSFKATTFENYRSNKIARA